jgi:hypothetical protein
MENSRFAIERTFLHRARLFTDPAAIATNQFMIPSNRNSGGLLRLRART